MISLVGRDGLRHEIDSEGWISRCCAWVVRDMNDDGTGVAELRVDVTVPVPHRVLGSYQTVYTAGRERVTTEVTLFGPSEEVITCLMCLANDTGR